MESFFKLLIAHHSPQNRCFAPEGAVLYPEPKEEVPLKSHVPHAFTSTADRRTKSKYGWVAVHSGFSIDDFAYEFLKGPISAEIRQHLEITFRSIAKLDPDTPVVAEYALRGVEQRSMAFVVHRIFFAKGNR